MLDIIEVKLEKDFVLTFVMTCDGFVMTCDQLCTYYTRDQLCINI